MTEKSNTSLGREKILLWTEIIGLLKVAFEFAIKVVSYASSNSKFRVQLPAQG